MSPFEEALLICATAALVLSLFSNIRGAAWIVALIMDLMLSDLYTNAGLPYAEAVMASLDFTVCLLIYSLGAHRWELWLFAVFQASMLISIIDMAANMVAPGYIDREVYLTMLEIANYAAIILIGGVASYAFADHFSSRAFQSWDRFFPFIGIVHGQVRRVEK